ncbi:MAG: multiheme c-type cytochrome [Deltaproteobacteria bacterium]|nr:multiheme c-type cytochrome [Deltaproteobacteria bacterium]
MVKKLSLTTLLFITLTLIFLSCTRIAKWQEAHSPPDDACRHCHYTIYKNWKIAYRPYNEAIKREDYDPVHASPMSASDVAKKRGHKLGKGDCSRCHVAAEPRTKLTISRIGASFEDTAFQLCGRCHVNTFEEWRWSRFASQKTACIDCHTYSEDQSLPEKKGYYHTKEGLAALTPDKINPALRIDKLRKALTLSENVIVSVEDITLSLMIANRGAGHNLPTGAIEAALLVKVDLIGEMGNTAYSARRIIGQGGESPISPDGEILLYMALPAPGKGNYKIDITLNHLDKVGGKENPVKVLQKRIDVTIK